jgi:hypothetical protein
MKNLLALISIFLFLGCNSSNTKTASGNLKTSSEKGKFTAKIKNKTYKVDITCSSFNKDYFTFLSDKTDVTDSNGDGLIISGFQDGKKMILTIIDNGKSLSSGNITDWSKTKSTFTGKGVLFEEVTANTLEVSFTVECN